MNEERLGEEPLQAYTHVDYGVSRRPGIRRGESAW